jgi:HPt (histidine-containing phosphotransfer) domain-containing protein
MCAPLRWVGGINPCDSAFDTRTGRHRVAGGLAAGPRRYGPALQAPPSWDNLMSPIATHFETRNGKSPCAGHEQPLNTVTLLKRCMDDSSLAATLLERFAARLSVVIQDIESAIAASDWSGAASKVHRLRGEAANLSATTLEAQATRLEEALRASRFAEAAAYLPALRAAGDECGRLLPAILRQLRSASCETNPCG